MAEYLDVYDANGEHVGTADRNVAHRFGLWHKTVHCWLTIELNGRVALVFQRRARNLDTNGGKLYTTASGHVAAGESIPDAFKREISEEIGLDSDALSPKFLYENIWVADIARPNKPLFVDRAFANIYYAAHNGALTDLKFDDGEVDGVVAIALDELIELLNGRAISVPGVEFDGQLTQDIAVSGDDFVLNSGETLFGKFGRVADMIKNAS